MGDPVNRATDEVVDCDVCVIGAGSGGLSVAAGAARLGARVVLIERAAMGGDCLNWGCVPSKSLLAAAHAAQAIRDAARFGVRAGEPDIDFRAVHDHVHDVIHRIEPNDSQERFEGLGVRVVRAHARFVGPREIEAGPIRVRARRFALATGSSPLVPPITGLDRVPYLTNETVFDLTERPRHLVVIGGGPIGIELAQAHRRLGSRVTVVEAARMLGRDDPDAVGVVRERLEAEGVELLEGWSVAGIEGGNGGPEVVAERNGERRRLPASHVLLAVGRRPNLDGLDLEIAGVEHGPTGIVVDRRLRTTNRRVFAVGDVAGGPQFTHAAAYHAGIVIRNALFRLPARADAIVPRVTYTEPELAQVGPTEATARQAHGDRVQAVRWPFADNDRAQAERDTSGFVKIVTGRGGRVLGATIVGTGAGELLPLWIHAVSTRMRIGAIAGLVLPYPTRAEAGKRAAGEYFSERLFGRGTRRLVRFLQRLP